MSWMHWRFSQCNDKQTEHQIACFLIYSILFLTDRQAGWRRISGTALAAGNAATSASVPTGPSKYPVCPWAHSTKGRTGQHTPRGAAPAASFRQMHRAEKKWGMKIQSLMGKKCGEMWPIPIQFENLSLKGNEYIYIHKTVQIQFYNLVLISCSSTEWYGMSWYGTLLWEFPP